MLNTTCDLRILKNQIERTFVNLNLNLPGTHLSGNWPGGRIGGERHVLRVHQPAGNAVERGGDISSVAGRRPHRPDDLL